MHAGDLPVQAISGFGITSQEAGRLVEFYRSAFDAEAGAGEALGGAAFEGLMGVTGGATRHCLQLGRQRLEILQFQQPGRAYPSPSSPYDTTFQHFAIVVADMASAMSRLQQVSGWQPLSREGPQKLPRRSGGVTAFKFRDPEGHPLELLAFPADHVPPAWRDAPHGALFLGIDHSAISVRDSAVSLAFYGELGFAVSGDSLNQGREQSLLDGVPAPQVRVTALSPAVPTPHLELLCYRSEASRAAAAWASNDVAATRTLLAVTPAGGAGPGERLVLDPDGHHLHFV